MDNKYYLRLYLGDWDRMANSIIISPYKRFMSFSEYVYEYSRHENKVIDLSLDEIQNDKTLDNEEKDKLSLAFLYLLYERSLSSQEAEKYCHIVYNYAVNEQVSVADVFKNLKLNLNNS